jgi:translocation and assembly module TamB
LTKFLGDRVSLGVHTGATPAQTGVGMDISIYKRFKVKGAIDATGGASAGVAPNMSGEGDASRRPRWPV